MINRGIKQICIPNPCTQNWGDMDIADKGRFCQSCQKNVTDFTKLSNEQILASLTLSGNTCGRITATQLKILNASIITPEPSRFSWRKFSIAAVVVSVLSLFRAEAKVITPKVAQYQNFSFNKTEAGNAVIDDQRTVTGKVVDENNEPLPGATIRIKGTQQGAITAVDGSFSIKVPVGKKVKLQIVYIGYESMEIKVRPRDDSKLSLKLKMSSVMLGGMGVVYHSSKMPIA